MVGTDLQGFPIQPLDAHHFRPREGIDDEQPMLDRDGLLARGRRGRDWGGRRGGLWLLGRGL